MKISRVAGLIALVYAGEVLGETCTNNMPFYKILRGPLDKTYVDTGTNRFWPRDQVGLENQDNTICRKGYTCLPNYPSMPKPLVQKIKIPNEVMPKSAKYDGFPYIPTTPPGGGCLGLNVFPEASLQSVHTSLYAAICTDCTDAKYRSLAIVYTSFNNPDAKWVFEPKNGKCAIRNKVSGYYLSRCDNCAANITTSLGALFRKSIDDATNDELWTVTRTTAGYYTFESASGTGEFLAVCEGCLRGNTTTTSPIALFKTLDSVKGGVDPIFWSVNISTKMLKYIGVPTTMPAQIETAQDDSDD
ncbi:hypothetical protein NEOKW01_0303 [Nematocida sp. AWRm80]|nr:hypothetical protein NEOKW01_0303 [Nematocida sp. AWRm80]